MGFFDSILALILFIFTFTLFILGLVLIVVGGYGCYEFYQYNSDVVDTGDIAGASIFVIILGIIIFMVGCSGCLGALRKSSFLLHLYAGLLTLVIIAEIVVAIVAFSMSGDLTSLINTSLNQTLDEYSTDVAIQVGWDQVQKNFKCCGVKDNYRDWTTFLKGLIPESCCKSYDTCAKETTLILCNPDKNFKGTSKCFKASQLTVNQIKNLVFSKDCYSTVSDSIKSAGHLVAAIALIFGLVEIVGVLVALMLARDQSYVV